MALIAIPLCGGEYTNMVAYFPNPVIKSGSWSSGVQALSGWAGTGVTGVTEAYFVDDASTEWTEGGSSAFIERSQGRKAVPWGLSQWERISTIGSQAPNCWGEFGFYQDSPAPSYPPYNIQWMAFYGNTLDGGETGPEYYAIQNSRSWTALSTQPGTPDARRGSVKSYPANQLQFGPNAAGTALSAFSRINGRAWGINPAKPAAAYPNIIYEEAFDIYLHYDNEGTVEIMFWTFNHNQDQMVGPYVETVDLGNGPIWDLYVTQETLDSGGQADDHPYGIFYLKEEYQGDNVGWIDMLRGLRYFTQYFVRSASTPDPLNLPLWQITHGWEICNTDYNPVEFRLRDYQLDIA